MSQSRYSRASDRDVGSTRYEQAFDKPAAQRDVLVLARCLGNRAFSRLAAVQIRAPAPAPGALLQRAPAKPSAGAAGGQPAAAPLSANRQLPPMRLPPGVEMVDLDKIEYTQPGISFYTREGVSVGRMAAQMQRSGWDPDRPADIVRMPGGRLVTLDHRRMWAAERAGNIRQIPARVHAMTETLDAASARRFAIERGAIPAGENPVTKRPWRAGDEPATWGDAVRFRSAVQEFSKIGRLGYRGYDPRVLGGGAGTRDPSFPPEGTQERPRKVQPGPFSYEKLSRPGSGGGGPSLPPTFTAGQRITAAAVLVALAANAALNKIISYQNERDIKARLDRSEAQLQAEQVSDPSTGFLFVLHFAGGVDSLEGPTAEARFQGLTWVRGRNESDARAKVSSQDPSGTYETAWIAPLAPEVDWGDAGLGKFADLSKLEFKRLGFAQIGGFSVKRRVYPANLSAKSQKWARGLRFHVLRPPAHMSYRGVRGRTETESIDIEERDVVDGRVDAMIIHGTPIVPVIAADAQTLAFFRADADLSLDHSGVVQEPNIDDIRWLAPNQIEMVNGPNAQAAEWAKEHPNWENELPFGKLKPSGSDDPDIFQWDRIKEQWVQKRHPASGCR